MNKILLVLFFTFSIKYGIAQPGHENIPASISSEQSWWNLLHYTIDIKPDYNNKFITGTNSIEFCAIMPGRVLQLDLMQPLSIRSITWNKTALNFTRKDDIYLVQFPLLIKINELVTITVLYEGKPKEAVNAPWDGGWIWANDKKNRPWMSLSCESPGAKIWLPCKNVTYDEPDSGVNLNIIVPDTLVGVANGRLLKKISNTDGTVTYCWAVINPINDYDICPYIGKYVSWHHNYAGLNGNLDCDYWVLDYNKQKATMHLMEVDTMLQCFEEWMGPYPFYQDSYKLVEAPMAGMEHQSAIAYGNGFENGYNGKNLSGTKWGLKWDFILIHESGHEWFGNSITAHESADSWIHEGFTKYLETIYTNWLFGQEAGNEYTLGIFKRIKNDEPIIGSGTSDEYNKGCALLHMIRQLTGDSAFKKILHDLNKTFYHQTVSTAQILQSMNLSSGKDFSSMFKQYLTTTQVPVLEYYFKDDSLHYHWANCVEGFNMPVKIGLGKGKDFFISPLPAWQKVFVSKENTRPLVLNSNFYIGIKETLSL